MSLAPFVQIVARGQGRARSMTFDEAKQAMGLILEGKAAAEAVGALLMVMRLRGETAAEIARFRQEHARHGDRHGPHAARVASQIEHERGHALVA